MSGVAGRHNGWDDRLFNDERPFVAARIDPARFGALWRGPFAETIDEPMPAIVRDKP